MEITKGTKGVNPNRGQVIDWQRLADMVKWYMKERRVRSNQASSESGISKSVFCRFLRTPGTVTLDWEHFQSLCRWIKESPQLFVKNSRQTAKALVMSQRPVIEVLEELLRKDPSLNSFQTKMLLDMMEVNYSVMVMANNGIKDARSRAAFSKASKRT